MTDRQIKAVAEAIYRKMSIDGSVCSVDAAQAAIDASDARFVPMLVEALRRLAYMPLGGDTATYFCGVNMQNIAKQALAQLPEEYK